MFPFLSLLVFSFVMIAFSVSTEIVWAPPPNGLVKAGSCDDKKKNKESHAFSSQRDVSHV